MQKELSAFFAQIGVDKKSQYFEESLTFLSQKECKILYRDRELFFLKNNTIDHSYPLQGKSDSIVEFDGKEMLLIAPSYYLGTRKKQKKLKSGYFDSSNSFHSNNNNNNNNNNGNNNG